MRRIIKQENNMSEQGSIFNDEVVRELSGALYSRKETVAVAESVTAGLMQAALASGENATHFFQGGLTAYNLLQKHVFLHIDIAHALTCNCVSEQIAAEMAIGISRSFGTNWGLGITGYAAPLPGHHRNELFAFFAISFNQEPVHAGKIITPIKPVLEVQLEYCNKILEAFSQHLEKEP